MQATRIIAVRHGETAWNVEQRIQGHLDIGLNALGRWQAQQLAQALAEEPIDAIYASDLQRAWHTAQAVGALLACPLQPEPGLRERAFGVLEGHSHAEIEANWPDVAQRWRQRDPLWEPAGGEALLALRQRVLQTVSSLVAAHTNGQILLVTHGGVLDILYRLATRQELQAPRSWALGNAAINRLLHTSGGFTLVGWNDAVHLESAQPGLDDASVY